MTEKGLLEGKRVLIVDDEPDVLETLEESLPMCEVAKAASFEKAKELLETDSFDIAILDIMGVDGYALLEIATEKNVVALMLTSHAFSPEHTIRAFKEGAASYIPKEHITEIVTYLEDILEAKEKGKNFWWRWLQRFGAFYDKKFGSDWRNMDEDFLERLKYYDRL